MKNHIFIVTYDNVGIYMVYGIYTSYELEFILTIELPIIGTSFFKCGFIDFII
jgi:hypothetical protein